MALLVWSQGVVSQEGVPCPLQSIVGSNRRIDRTPRRIIQWKYPKRIKRVAQLVNGSDTAMRRPKARCRW